MVEKNKVKIWMKTFASDQKLLQNMEWKFISLKERPEFELNVPGTMDEQDYFSADWSVSKFSLGSYSSLFN